MSIDYLSVCQATWPPATSQTLGPWIINEGQGGGKRVSAARACGAVAATDVPNAEAAMEALGQDPLFMIGPDDSALDQLLATAGYEIVDPVAIYAAPLAQLTTERPPRISAFAIWEPLEIMNEIWSAGGIGPERRAVMDRVHGAKTAIFGRHKDRAAGAAFVAIHDGCAMLHALEVARPYRRQGTAINMLRLAAFWAQDHGAETLALLAQRENIASNALCASLKMQLVGQYHYRRITR